MFNIYPLLHILKNSVVKISFVLFFTFSCIYDGTAATITSNGTGDWNIGGTWIGGNVPGSTDDVVIQAGHYVFTGIGITRNASTIVNGWFEIRSGGFAGGSFNMTYSQTDGGLIFSHTGYTYDVASGNTFWPITNGPFNLILNPSAIIALKSSLSGTRNIPGTATLDAGLFSDYANAFGISGILELKFNGQIGNFAPVYTTGSSLKYIGGGNYESKFEWPGTGTVPTSAGVGVPSNIQISNNTNFYFNTTLSNSQYCFGNLTIDAGSTLSQNNQGLVVKGNYTLAGTHNYANVATFTAFNGNLSYVSGYTNNTNTRYTTLTNPSVVQTISSTGLAPNFNCLQLSGTGSAAVQVQLLTNITTDGNSGTSYALIFSNVNDIVDLNGFQMTLGNVGFLSEILNSGRFKGSPTSSLIFNGNSTGVQTIKFLPASDTLNNLTINRSADVKLASTLTASNVILSNGSLDIDAFDLTIQPTGSITNTTTNYIKTPAAGTLKKRFTAAGTFIFPVGRTNYTPATITLTGGNYALGAFLSANVVNNVHPFNGAIGSIVKLNRYWNTAASGITGYSADLSFTYQVGDVSNALIENTMKMAGFNGTNWRLGSSVNATLHTGAVTGISEIRQAYTAADLFSPLANTDYYQTRGSGTNGNWNATNVWTSSTSGVAGTFVITTVPPDKDANTITILSGDNINIATASVNFDELTVNGTITLMTGGIMTVYDGPGDDITINNGGKLFIAKTGAGASEIYTNSIIASTSQLRVKSGGLIQIIGASSSVTGYEALMSNTNNAWENASTYQHNSSATSLSLTGGVTLFPNAGTAVIPIFRIDALTGDYSSSSAINLNGLLEVNNVNLSIIGNTGSKNFRNGFTGNGTLTFPIGTAAANITGTPSIISGTLTLNLNRSLNINESVIIPTSSSITVANGSVGTMPIANGKIFSVANGATFDIGNSAAFSGSTGTLQIDGLFKTSNTGGFTSSRGNCALILSTGSTVEFNGTNQAVGTETFYNLTFSNSGNKTNTSTLGVNMQTAGALTISGSAVLDATVGQIGNTAANTNRLTMSGSSKMILRSNNVQLPNMDGAYNLSGTSVIQFGGKNQTIRSNASIGYANIEIGDTATVANSSGIINLKSNGIFTVVTGGSYTQNSQRIRPFILAADPTVSVVVQDGGTFRVGVTDGLNGGTNTAIENNISNIVLGPNSIVEYFRAGNQSITNANILIYGNLVLSGSGVKTAPASILELKGTFNSALSGSGNSFDHNGGTVYFSSITTAQSYTAVSGSPIAFYKLQTQNSAGLNMTSDAIVENELKLLTASTKMNISGYLTLRSTPTLTASVAELPSGMALDPFTYTGAGRFNIERYLPGYKSWRLLATPIKIDGSQTIFESWQEFGVNNASVAGYGVQISSPLFPSSGFDYYTPFPSLKVYNPTTVSYDQVTNTSVTLANTQGYYLFVRGDRAQGSSSLGFVPTTLRMKGKINVLDQPPMIVPAGKFNTLANPYPSRIAFRTITKTNMANAFTVWNPALYGTSGVGGFELYGIETATGRYKNAATGLYRDSIESGEAVFVQNILGSDGSFIIKESDKRVGSQTVSRSLGIPDPELRVILHTNDTNGDDYTPAAALINFDHAYSNGLDNDDFRKFLNSTENVSVKNGSYLLEVERRKMVTEADTIFLSLSRTQAKPYTLQLLASNIIAPGLQAFLIDKFTSTQSLFSLDGSTDYAFVVTSNAGSYAADRFHIIFKQTAVLPVTFTSITANRNADKTVAVSWKVESESSIKEYNVENSTDGVNYDKIGTVAAQNNGLATTYNFTHTNASIKANFYRIRSIDVASSAKLSATAKVNAIIDGSTVQIVPNPVKAGVINLVSNLGVGRYSVRLIDSKGSVVFSSSVTQNVGTTNTSIKVGNVPAGIYQLLLVDANNTITSTKVIME